MLIGLLADAHGCIEAFDKALKILEDHGAEKIYFLGDAVGYFPGLHVVERITEVGIPSLKGNHEEMLLSSTDSAEKEQIYQLAVTRNSAADTELELIARWPRKREIANNENTASLVHGSLYDPTWGYVYPETDLNQFATEYKTVFMAHTHRPFIRKNIGTLFVNIGSCSLPRDAGLLGSVCLYSAEDNMVKILRFDITNEFRDAVKRCGNIHSDVLKLASRPITNSVLGTRVG